MSGACELCGRRVGGHTHTVAEWAEWDQRQEYLELSDEQLAAGEPERAQGVLAQLYYTKDELEVLLMSVGMAISAVEENLRLVRAPATKTLMQKQRTLLNSLRTSLAEARYGLMTREEIDAERQAQAEARAAGIIP